MTSIDLSDDDRQRLTIPLDPEVQRILSLPPGVFINGRRTETRRGAVLDVINPSTGQLLWRAAEADGDDVDVAVCAARAAADLGVWTIRISPSDRQRCLWRLGDLIEREARVFGQLDALDCGRPFSRVALGDVPASAEHFAYYAGWATKLNGRTYPVDSQGMHVYSVREPVGVVGLITPWNYPLLMAAWKLAPALAAGNCVVLKPAEQTPLSALFLAELAIEAGIPEGVFNVVTGIGAVAGAALVEHPAVDKIGFTGSVDVARSIVRASAIDLKRVSLELGGKSPNIVFADADLNLAVEGSLWATMGNSGQSCTAGSRLYVQEGIYEEFVQALIARASSLTVGAGLASEACDLGPLITDRQMTRVLGWIDSAKSDGATVMCGGQRMSGENAQGFYVEPTVIADVTDDLDVVKEEIFGPVLAVMPFRDRDEVIERANNSRFGLAAGVWSNDLSTVHEVSSRIRAGTIWVNTWGLTSPAVPFGGMKQSGKGREMGEDALELYTETKSVWMGWQNPVQ